MIKAILFDMDGTLFDTEAIYAEGWLRSGVPYDVYVQLIGLSQEDEQKVLAPHGFDFDTCKAVVDEYTALTLKKGIPLKPGTREILAFAKERGLRTSIATSSEIKVADDYLEQTGLGPFFDAVVSGYNLPHGKPAPDIFLIAADRLGISPEECLVVEDSINGIRAGKAAGMKAVMIPDRIEPTEEIRQLADAVLPSLLDLMGWLEVEAAHD